MKTALTSLGLAIALFAAATLAEDNAEEDGCETIFIETVVSKQPVGSPVTILGSVLRVHKPEWPPWPLPPFPKPILFSTQTLVSPPV